MKKELKPCPFCGEIPMFESVDENYGTFYEFSCDCGLSGVSIQISDLMTLNERVADALFINGRYSSVYRKRARNEAIKRWNTRR